MKKGKLLFGLILSLLVFAGVSIGTKAYAKEIKPATVQILNLSETDGSELKGGKTPDSPFRVNATFNLPAGVKKGDTTTLTLPKELDFNGGLAPFDIKDSTNNVVAKATLGADGRSVVLTYTEYVETHSGVHGSFYFAVKVDKTAVQDPGKLPIVFDVSGEPKNAGTVDYVGIGVPGRALITKSGTALAREDNVIRFQLSINRDQQTIKNAVIEDTIDPAFVGKFMAGTVTVEKGTWNWDKAKGGWTFDNKTNVTATTTFTVTDNKITINLGDMGPNDQYYITYKARADYDLVPGEEVPNTATLKGDGKEPTSSSVKVKYTEAGGQAEGYVYEIKIVKVDDEGKPVPGAKFDVVRVANKLTVAQVVTGPDGTVSVPKLLLDDYKLVETEAPAGYDKAADTDVEVNDFINKVATKQIVDPKKKTTTTTVTTTAASTTSTTTTETPMTTSTTATTEASTTSGTTTTTTEASTTSTTATTTGSTTTVTTTEAPTTTTTAASTTTTKPVDPATTKASTTTTVNTTKPSAKTTVKKSSLPSTGEQTGLWTGLLGVILMGSGLFFYRSRKNS
ncbi:LPXTG cell wall anchor domain-containing protein [Streptococcus ferus]|uniref:LPXTG cell wall anchor domain-containing protein n=1 Tax=Streptococcus ferus TaxID=1345 RepID=UPI0023538D26|nr:LPXTG cell wall anchor domain-containing protein [Streptococcus ferus]